MGIRRNDACTCGSGRKYKHCCERAKRSILTPGVLILLLILLVGGILATSAVLRSPDPSAPPPGKVWSPEHGHWHDVAPSGEAQPGGAPVPQPPGPPPPGKVWSAEHGHWHGPP